MAIPQYDAAGDLLAWKLEHTAQQVDDTIEGMEDKADQTALDAEVAARTAADNELKSALVNTDNRLSVFDRFYNVEWEQGAYIGADHKTKSDSAYYIRTKDMYDYSILKTDAIYTGFGRIRLSFFDANKDYLSQSSWNSFTPNSQASSTKYFTAEINDNSGVTPSVITGTEIMMAGDTITEKVLKNATGISASNLIIKFEQGGLANATAKRVASNATVRTVNPFPLMGLYKIGLSTDYSYRLYFYNGDMVYRGYETVENKSEYILRYGGNYATDKYMDVVAFKSGTTITYEDGNLYGVKPYGLYEYYNNKDNRDIIDILKPQYPVIDTCILNANDGSFGNTISGAFMVTNDLHSQYRPLDDANAVKQFYSTKKSITLLNCGDIVASTPKISGSNNPDIAGYMSKAAAYGVYHAMGQHEVGFAYDNARAKNTCMTNTEVFETFIEPMKTVWGLPDLDTIYYYKDFAIEKIRLISLYLYNAPILDDPSDNTKYKYPRGLVWMGTDQLQWYADTLNTTPDGYGVLVIMHQPEANVENSFETPFFYGTAPIVASYNVADGTPVYDITNAYISKGTINETYTPSNTTKYPVADGFSETVTKDFSSANGTFIGFITGDAHIDYVGKIADTDLINIGLTSSGAPCDAVRKDLNFSDKTSGAGGNIDSTLLTVIGVRSDNGSALVGRVGQQFSYRGQHRTIVEVSP